MRRAFNIDKTLALLIAILVLGGAMIFASAAFGLLARGSTTMSSVVFSHLVLGVGVGTVALIIGCIIDYRVWRRFAPHIFILTIVLTTLVFIPGLGFEHGGGKRWIVVFGTSFQPSEALKLGAIIMAATYFAVIRNKVDTWKYGLGGFLALLAIPAILLIAQPDLGTLGVIGISLLAIYFTAGARWRDMVLVVCVALVAITILAALRPYVRDRVTTFFSPGQNQHAEGYQIKQSLIAIGSGGIFGRGFGQGVQKFTYLPEPMGDSIFAVAAEELGFVGAVGIVGLFLAFALRGYGIAARAPDPFGALLAVGICTYLSAEAFINIAAMLGLAPLTGIPLTFISQGGSAMLVCLASAGILLSVSRTAHKR